MAGGKELWRVYAEVIPFGTEVVVNHIEQHHDSALMGGLHPTLLDLRGVRKDAVGREGNLSVITPISFTGKFGDRHDFQRGHASFSQVIEAFTHRKKIFPHA